MSKGLELDIRQKIYQLISKHPGVHARKIAELLCLQGQLVDYHLQFLEKQKLITSIRQEGYRRYFLHGELGQQEKVWMSVLRRKAELHIVLYLLEHPNALNSELLEVLGLAPSTMSYHLKRLRKQGLVAATRQGKEKRFQLTNPEEIIRLLIQYKSYFTQNRFDDALQKLKKEKRT